MSSALASIDPVDRRESLGAMVRERLRSALMAGQFQPGERLTIRAVAAALDVSLTPARDALYNLVAEGVLETAPSNKTVYVPELDNERIIEISRIRLSLEGLAARYAAPNVSDAQIAEAARIQRDLVAAHNCKDFTRLMRLNWEFHFGIYDIASMPMLKKIIENCWIKMGSYLNVLYPDYGEITHGIKLHEDILKALRERDPDGLCNAIQADIDQSTSYLLEMTKPSSPRPTLVRQRD